MGTSSNSEPVLRRGPGAKLLDRVPAAVRARHYSQRTEEAYVAGIRRYVLFPGKRHPDHRGAEEVAAFLSHPGNRKRVSA